MLLVTEEISSMELFDEAKIKISKFLAIEGINIDDYENWYQKFFSIISNYT